MPSAKSAMHLLADRSLHVLVTGATGRQGGAVVRRLLARGHRVRAVVRDPRAPAAAALRAGGVELYAGSVEDPAALALAAQLVDAAFLVGPPGGGEPAAETRGGTAAVDAFREADLPFLVYSSAASANRSTGVPQFDRKFAVETHLRSAGIPFAVLAPVSFMENLAGPAGAAALSAGRLPAGFGPDRKAQLVALDDLGAFVSLAVEQAPRFRGQRVEVASDEPTGAEAAAVLSRQLGRPIRCEAAAPDASRGPPATDDARLVDWLERHGFSVDVERLRRDYPAVGWHRFAEWAAEQSWTAARTGA